jgi:hypothetical protein
MQPWEMPTPSVKSTTATDPGTRTERTASLLAARATQLGRIPGRGGAAGLRSGLSSGQCHLPDGGRFGGRVRRGLPGLG